MKVFISWSGELSRAIAVELRDWLPMVVQQVQPWMSKRDIEPGKRWALILGQELELSDFAIICLTKDNLQAPWILFEAGAVARSIKARVIPLLFEMEPKTLDGPLAQFQSLSLNEFGIKQLVNTLHDDSKSSLERRQRDIVFSQMWSLLDDRIQPLLVQAKQKKTIESPIDIIADLASTEELQSPRITTTKNIFESIDLERKRLMKELDYLKKKEEELTKQDAPISLIERAIEPTERRVEVINTTLGVLLNKTFELLTLNQIALLRSLVTSNKTRVINSSKEWFMQNQSDISKLSQLGLVSSDKNGVIIIHDLIADYVAKTFGDSWTGSTQCRTAV